MVRHRRLGLFGLRIVALGSLVAGIAACSLLVDTTATQCRVDGDCTARGGAFADTVCDASRRVCVPRERCTSNQDCIDRAGGAPSVCRRSDGACQPVLSEDCVEVAGPIANDNAIVIGSLLPLTGTLADVGVPVQRSLDLALNEINAVGAGLPMAGSADRRPLVVVKCDEGKDPIRATSHLVKDVGITALIGPFNSGVALRAAPEVTVPAGVLMLSPGATAPSLALVGGGSLVWRTAASDVHQARALTRLIPVVEAEHRVEWEIPDAPEGVVKVAMIVRGDSSGIELAQAMIESGLTFNGRSLAGNGPFFARRDYPDPAVEPNVDYAGIVDFLVQFQPNIVILLTGAEGASQIVLPLEQRWPTGVAQPWYVVSHGARTRSLLEVAKANDEIRRRVRGTVPERPNPQFDAFDLAFRGAYQAPANIYGMAQAYDAAYLLAYGIVAGGAPVTGASIGSGLKRMSSGPPVAVGPGPRLSETFATLAEPGSTISFLGAAGAYRFDPATGESPFDVDVWCIGKELDGSPTFRPSSQYYDAARQELVGTFSCD